MSTKQTNRSRLASAGAEKESNHVQDVTNVSLVPETHGETLVSPPAKEPGATAVRLLADALATSIGAGLGALAAAFRRSTANWGKHIAFGLIGITGAATGYGGEDAVLKATGIVQTTEYVGYTLALKPTRDCKTELPARPSAEQIDAHLRNPDNYAPNERHVWEITYNRISSTFSGTQWLERRGQLPMSVGGYFSPRDQIDGSLKSAKGRGVYSLSSRSNEDIYRGQMIALECSLPVNVVLVCPYVLTSADQARDSDPYLKGKFCRRWEESAGTISLATR